MAPYYGAVVEEMFDKEMLVLPANAPSFDEARDAWCTADWIGTAKGYIDPVKEVQAAAMRIAKGLSTYEKECGEQGDDYKAIILQRVKEIRLMLDEGLPAHVVYSIYGSGATEQAPPVESGADGDADGTDAAAPDGPDGPSRAGALAPRRTASGVPLVRRRSAA